MQPIQVLASLQFWAFSPPNNAWATGKANSDGVKHGLCSIHKKDFPIKSGTETSGWLAPFISVQSPTLGISREEKFHNFGWSFSKYFFIRKFGTMRNRITVYVQRSLKRTSAKLGTRFGSIEAKSEDMIVPQRNIRRNDHHQSLKIWKILLIVFLFFRLL